MTLVPDDCLVYVCMGGSVSKNVSTGRFSLFLYPFLESREQEKRKDVRELCLWFSLDAYCARKPSWVGLPASRGWRRRHRWYPGYNRPGRLMLLKFELGICSHVIAYGQINCKWPPKERKKKQSSSNNTLKITKWTDELFRENQHLLGGCVSLLGLPRQSPTSQVAS